LEAIPRTGGALHQDLDQAACTKRGISQSALIVAAVEALLDASGQIDHLTPFIGVIKGASPRLSESVDDIYR
jgi:hypothetical protein